MNPTIFPAVEMWNTITRIQGKFRPEPKMEHHLGRNGVLISLLHSTAFCHRPTPCQISEKTNSVGKTFTANNSRKFAARYAERKRDFTQSCVISRRTCRHFLHHPATSQPLQTCPVQKYKYFCSSWILIALHSWKIPNHTFLSEPKKDTL